MFVAVVMDTFSRKIVGWNLGPKLTTDLALTALKNAIESRQPAPGLIHHSDRGVQYASAAYVDMLLQHSTNKWTSVQGWREALNRFQILWPERMPALERA